MNRENLTTWFVVLAALLAVAIWGGMSFDFQRHCESTCAPRRASTPFIGLQETCLCDEGHGRWRHVGEP